MKKCLIFIIFFASFTFAQQSDSIINYSQELAEIRIELEELRAQIAVLSLSLQKSTEEESRFLAGLRYVLTPRMSRGSSVLHGFEYEFGGQRRDKLLFTGTTMLVFAASNSRKVGYDTIRVFDWDGYEHHFSHFEYCYYEAEDVSLGWGAGAFLGRFISAGEVFSIVSGLNLGYWFYLGRERRHIQEWYRWQGYEHYWGGPDIRVILGYDRLISFDLSYKAQIGMRRFYGSRIFNIRNLWAAGLIFSPRIRR